MKGAVEKTALLVFLMWVEFPQPPAFEATLARRRTALRCVFTPGRRAGGEMPLDRQSFHFWLPPAAHSDAHDVGRSGGWVPSGFCSYNLAVYCSPFGAGDPGCTPGGQAAFGVSGSFFLCFQALSGKSLSCGGVAE